MQRLAIVCCIESGLLEAQTVRLAESVRRFGGSFRDAPIIAVRPRRGPSLAPQTRRSLRSLQIELIENKTNIEFAWHHYFNKLMALLAAEKNVMAEQYIWLDSDILVLREPKALLLSSDEDFAACAPDRGTLGSTGPADKQDDFWRRVCALLGMTVDDLPWVKTFNEALRIRFYLNSGVFSYRSGVNFAQSYLDGCLQYIRSKTPREFAEVHFMDQVMLGITAHRLNLRWRLLPHSSNYTCHSALLHFVTMPELASAEILHYHDMMEAERWPTFCDLLERAHHPLCEELVRLGPLRDPGNITARTVRELLRIIRGSRRRMYYKACGFWSW